MRVYNTDLNRHANNAMHFVYTKGTHANITPKATRASSNQWLEYKEASQHSAYRQLTGTVHGSLSWIDTIGIHLCMPCHLSIYVGTCIVMHTAMSKNHSLI